MKASTVWLAALKGKDGPVFDELPEKLRRDIIKLGFKDEEVAIVDWTGKSDWAWTIKDCEDWMATTLPLEGDMNETLGFTVNPDHTLPVFAIDGRVESATVWDKDVGKAKALFPEVDTVHVDLVVVQTVDGGVIKRTVADSGVVKLTNLAVR